MKVQMETISGRVRDLELSLSLSLSPFLSVSVPLSGYPVILLSRCVSSHTCVRFVVVLVFFLFT